jgi:hypothetical protein
VLPTSSEFNPEDYMKSQAIQNKLQNSNFASDWLAFNQLHVAKFSLRSDIQLVGIFLAFT